MYDVAYYTYGHFQSTVDVFKRVALFYAADNAWIIVIFVLGLMAAAAMAAVKNSANGLSGQAQGNQFMASLVFSLVGLVVFAAGVVPKGTVHVYDETTNQYEAVADVPALVSITAGFLSSFVETFRETESTANAYTYGELAQGSPFMMMKEALLSGRAVSSYPVQNINALYSDCGSTAIASGSLDVNDLRGGTYDLLALLEGLKHNAIETTIYSEAHPNGEAATCTEAYNHLKNELNDSTVFSRQLAQICDSVGLNTAIGSEQARCTQMLTDSFDTLYANGSGSVNWKSGLQNLIIAETISDALRNNAGDQAVNIQLSRNSLAESMGAMEATARYMPYIKGILLSVIIGMFPVLMIFIVTPMLGKALTLWFGLCAFYGIWQVCDMITLSAIQDGLYAAVSELRTHKMGLLSVWTTESALMDTFSLLGTTRSVGIGIAILVSVKFFQVSAHAMAGMAQNVEQGVEKEGGEAGKDSLLQENAGMKLEGMTNGNAAFASMASNMSGATSSRALDTSTGIKEAGIKTESFGSINSASQALSVDSASHQVGSAKATSSEGGEMATESARIGREGEFAEAAAVQKTATAQGQSTRSLQEDTASVSEGKAAGEAEEMQKGQGITENSLNYGRDEGAKSRAVGDQVEYHGTEDSYRVGRQEHEQSVEKAKAIDEQTGNSSREYFAKDSEREVAETRGQIEGAAEFPVSDIVESRRGDYVEDTASSLTKNEVTDGNDMDRKSFAEGKTTIEAEDSIAEQRMRDAMKDTLGVDDQELAGMMLQDGSYKVSSEQAETLHDEGLINDQQLRVARLNDGMVLDMNAFSDGDGNIQAFSTEAKYDESASIDKSSEQDESVTSDFSKGPMNSTSSRAMLSDSGDLLKYIGQQKTEGITDRELASEIGAQSADGLEPYLKFSEADYSVGENRVAANGSVGTPGIVGSVVGVEAKVESSNSKSDFYEWRREENPVTQHFNDVFSAIDSHYDSMAKSSDEFTESDADRATAEAFSGYFRHVKETMAGGEMNEFNQPLLNGELNDAYRDYQEETGLNIPLNDRYSEDDRFAEYRVGDEDKGMAGDDMAASPASRSAMSAWMEEQNSSRGHEEEQWRDTWASHDWESDGKTEGSDAQAFGSNHGVSEDQGQSSMTADSGPTMSRAGMSAELERSARADEAPEGEGVASADSYDDSWRSEWASHDWDSDVKGESNLPRSFDSDDGVSGDWGQSPRTADSGPAMTRGGMSAGLERRTNADEAPSVEGLANAEMPPADGKGNDSGEPPVERAASSKDLPPVEKL